MAVTPSAKADKAAAARIHEPWGQDGLKRRIGAAIAAGSLPQSILVYGPPGTGKRLLSLWIAAALHCEADETVCGTCKSCRSAARLEHPDIHLHFPMPRPKRAGSKANLRKAIERQRHERLAQLREDPLAQFDSGEVTGLYLAAVENLRSQADRRPSISKRAVFVVEDADKMAPQEANPEAANAFLKLLEEPPAFACIVIASSRRDALLPTILSRTVPLRVSPLPVASVEAYLAEQLGVSADRARSVARQADGAVYRARQILEDVGRDSRIAADMLLAAALAGEASGRYRAASRLSARGARGQFEPTLEALRRRLRDLLCEMSGASSEVFDPAGLAALAKGRTVTSAAVLRSLKSLEAAFEDLGRNLNPQAAAALLLDKMASAFAEG